MRLPAGQAGVAECGMVSLYVETKKASSLLVI